MQIVFQEIKVLIITIMERSKNEAVLQHFPQMMLLMQITY